MITIWDKKLMFDIRVELLMALIPLFEIRNIVTYKSVDKEKIKIILICMHAQCKQKQRKILRNRTCWPQVQN